jgi:hypothetical protein
MTFVARESIFPYVVLIFLVTILLVVKELVVKEVVERPCNFQSPFVIVRPPYDCMAFHGIEYANGVNVIFDSCEPSPYKLFAYTFTELKVRAYVIPDEIVFAFILLAVRASNVTVPPPPDIY